MALTERHYRYLAGRINYYPQTGLFYWHDGRRKGKLAGTISNTTGYRYIGFRGNRKKKFQILASRLAWYITHGELPNVMDHINRNRLDDRIVNLRSVTSEINSSNLSVSVKNKSGVSGVHWDTTRQKWLAQIRAFGSRHHLIRTTDFELACFVREEAEGKKKWLLGI